MPSGHRKKRLGTPGFGHRPNHPLSGEFANLRADGIFPYVAMMQVAAEDTYRDYVICRGVDPRNLRFIDYDEYDADKPGISVAKPFGKRTAGTYSIGQVFPAVLPIQGKPDYTPPTPTTVDWRVGLGPGVVDDPGGGGHPQSLDDTIEQITDHNDKYIQWMLIDTSGGGHTVIQFRILEAGPFYSEEADECDTVLGEVIAVSCSGTGVEVGDEVTLWDPQRCHLTIPVEILLQSVGWAVNTSGNLDETDCFDTQESGVCRWVIQTLCCAEEVMAYDGGGA